MKAHPALFEGEGVEGWSRGVIPLKGIKGGDPKNETLLFQSTVDIHFQNAHKHTQETVKARILCFYEYHLQFSVY